VVERGYRNNLGVLFNLTWRRVHLNFFYNLNSGPLWRGRFGQPRDVGSPSSHASERWDRLTQESHPIPRQAELPERMSAHHLREAAMVTRYVYPTATTTELAPDPPCNRDEEVMRALVTAGALVALADGQVKAIERDELVNFIDRQGFVPSISRREIAEAFDNRVQQLEGRDSADAIAETLRPLAGLSLASVVVRTATQVAAADRYIHPGEVRALKLIRLALTTQDPVSNSSGTSMEEPGGSSD
jgi:tellurite resistance protein